jgi:predicted DNA-binding transcriptional regulator AlpA
MPIHIDGVAYVSAADLLQDLGIARQTLWRWRKARKIPPGRRYRGRDVVFTKEEVEIIREYANRLEPAEPALGVSDVDQMSLFNTRPQKRNVS